MNKPKKKTKYIWKIYKITNGRKAYVGLTSQSLTKRFYQHKKNASDLKNGVKLPTTHFAYTRRFYGDLLNGKWRIELLDQVKGDHDKAIKIEERMKKKYETYT